MLPKVVTALAVCASLASAQTFTVCNPLKKKCPNNKAIGAKPVTVDFTQGKNTFFTELDGTQGKIKYDSALGATFSIENDQQAPTIESEKTIFYGKVDVVVRAAPGAGIVTSLVLQSLDLDEIDWEWVGNDVAQVQTNYFSKGCDSVFDRGTYVPVANPQAEFHTYTLNWTPEKLEWIVNGNVVRTLNKAGLSGCSGYPQTPMQIKLGTWVGGRKGAPPGTVTWAGGMATFGDNISYKGYYQKVTIVDYMGGDGTPGSGASDATEYEWTDNTGDSGSIKVIGGDGKGSDKTTTTSSSSSTKSSIKTTSSTTLATVTSSASSASGTSSAGPSDGTESSGSSTGTGTGTGTGSSGPSKTGTAPATSSTTPSGGEKLALPLGMGLAALIAALL